VKVHVVLHYPAQPFILGWLGLLGIGADRIVGGKILAQEAFITEAMGCGAPGERPMQLLLLQKELRERLTPGPIPTTPAVKTIVLIKRDGGQRATGLTLDFEQVQHVVQVFLRTSGLQDRWAVEVFSDSDEKLLGCVACTQRLFSRASLLIGKHGAALSNMLFMRPGTMVFEQWDYGLPPCYLDLAVQLGLQYRLLHGQLGYFPRQELIEYLLEFVRAEAGGGTAAASTTELSPEAIFAKAKEEMPMAHCCRTVTAPCAACWTNSTESAFCTKWKNAVPECQMPATPPGTW
jgi:hypothetical protein